MKPSITIDMKEIAAALKNINIGEPELMHLKGAGELVLVNGMRTRVAVDTSATKNSIMGHVIESGDTKVVDDVGPETAQSIWLEYGTGIHAEKGNGRKTPWVYKNPKSGKFVWTQGMRAQPFIRPTVEEDGDKVNSAISASFKQLVESRWAK